MTLYDYLPSQNAWKVRLLLNQLDIPYERVLVSIFEGEGRSEDFLRINPTGRVPALRLEDGRTLAESNAIPLGTRTMGCDFSACDQRWPSHIHVSERNSSRGDTPP